ncbi:unnamed protein product [Lactuca saligna]|uniref:Uncharacterized protein n=1 Tax=Lactuca saligna TaxID=75948 RepID=A0AA35UL17_LACSI|nr:unnamed protein product [Lactuca saligna]
MAEALDNQVKTKVSIKALLAKLCEGTAEVNANNGTISGVLVTVGYLARVEDFDEFEDVDMLYNTLSLDKVEALEDLVIIGPPGLVKKNSDGQKMLASTLIPQPMSITNAGFKEDIKVSFGSMLLHGLAMSEHEGGLEVISCCVPGILEDTKKCSLQEFLA